MSKITANRKQRKPNIVGCWPDGDVCIQHDAPLVCPHGCKHVIPHKCVEKKIKQCEWKENREDEFDTGCGKGGAYLERGFNYCPYCGLTIKLE